MDSFDDETMKKKKEETRNAIVLDTTRNKNREGRGFLNYINN